MHGKIRLNIISFLLWFAAYCFHQIVNYIVCRVISYSGVIKIFGKVNTIKFPYVGPIIDQRPFTFTIYPLGIESIWQPATIDPTLDLYIRYPLRLGAQSQH